MVLKSDPVGVLDFKLLRRNLNGVHIVKYVKHRCEENSDQFSLSRIEFKEIFFSVAREIHRLVC